MDGVSWWLLRTMENEPDTRATRGNRIFLALRSVDNRLMDFFFLAFFATIGVYAAKTAEQRQRIALLSSHLQKFQLEKHMEQLIDGYLRALGENDPQRSAPIWSNLESIEAAVREELTRLADDLHGVWGERTRVSRWPVAVPFANRLFPASTFDLRTLLKVHARGFDTTLRNGEQLVRRDQLLLKVQHAFVVARHCNKNKNKLGRFASALQQKRE